MSGPSTSQTDQAQTLQILADEVGSCDRCYQRYYNILQTKSTSTDNKKKKNKTKTNQPNTFTNHPLFRNFDFTGGGLIEPGPLGKNIFDLSTAISKAATLSPKRKEKQLEQSCKNIQLCESNLENLKKKLVDVMNKKVELRIDGIMNGTSAEGKKVESSIKEKYRIRKEQLNEKCRLQMDALRKQLEADIDFEEKNAKITIEKAKQKRLKQIDDELTKIGCSGDDFLVNGPKLEVLESEIVEVDSAAFKGQVVLPLNKKVDKRMRELERKELQNFCLYARAPARVGKVLKKKNAALRLSNVQLNGSFWAPLTEVE
ncbi:unnamed protein product [Bursaphelenchus okinawaensis]|uniref:Uncharacterized protein n=1 Tax=Bursaphelenchus okinawaensis TaxID=465554 RepID=A0A811L7T4_9BILA|nr:unnamed protein product [Bursaphelenchus okinawaensis]CAG9118552.1 unnamed protein product [Bursaphelenchus okinawaensis]